MNRLVIALVAALVATPALAQEPRGCDKFKWPLAKEHALLTSPAAAKTRSGASLDVLPATALAVSLEPAASAKLPMAPERAPKQPGTFSGFVRIGTLPKPGSYLVTLSSGAWIDVVQAEHYVKSAASSSVQGCDGMRKSVKFDLAAGPLAVQLSGVATDTIVMTVTPAGE